MMWYHPDMDTEQILEHILREFRELENQNPYSMVMGDAYRLAIEQAEKK